MARPTSYDYQRYLKAKRSIDACALNHHVWQTFLEELHEKQDAIRILEIGGGIGSTAERILAAAELTRIEYTFVDVSEVNVRLARRNLHHWADNAGYTCEQRNGMLQMQKRGQSHSLKFVAADLFEFLAPTKDYWDVIVAQAVLDLVNLRAAFDAMWEHLESHALLYFPIHFDGLTAFEPTEDPARNRRILDAYHQTMDTRPTRFGHSGGRHTGRSLMLELRQKGADLLAAGSSDWVLTAGADGFTDKETYFLYHMLHFVETSLTETKHSAADPEELNDWLEKRRVQIENGSLLFIAHQLDVVAAL